MSGKSPKLPTIPNLLTPLHRIRAAVPKLSQKVDALRARRGKDIPAWPNWCFLPYQAGHGLVPPVTDHGWFWGELIMMASWQVSQGIYEFDPDVYEAVVSTPVGKVPCEVLYHLPEWSVFVPSPSFKDSPGFWARLAWSGGGFPTMLKFVILRTDGSVSQPGIELHAGRTLEQTVKATWEEEVKQIKSNPYPTLRNLEFLAAWQDPDFRRQEHERVLRWVEPRLALLLYLCSVNREISHPDNRLPAKPRAKKTKRGARHFPAANLRTWNVGIRLGAALRSARKNVSSRTSSGNGSPKRPHIRRAHWHSYWTGPQNGKRIRVVKWLPPISVKVDRVEDLPVTVRRYVEVGAA